MDRRIKAGSLAVCLCAAMLCRAQGIITTYAGADVAYPGSSFSAMSASFGLLSGVAVSSSGEVYFASQTRALILKFNPKLNSVSIVAGIATGGYSGDGGPATSAALNGPQQIAFDPSGNLYIADLQNYAIRKIDTQGIITTYATIPGQPSSVTVASDGTLYVSTYGQIFHINSSGAVILLAGSTQQGYGGDNGPAIKASFSLAKGLLFDNAGNLLVADTGNNRIRRIDTQGNITTIAGNGQYGSSVNGPATATPIQSPVGLAFDAQRNLYTGTTTSQLIKISSSGALTVLNPNASTFFLNVSGPVASALIEPQWPAFDAAGDLFFTDQSTEYLWELTTAQTIQVAAAYAPAFALGDGGPAALASFNFPNGIWAASDGSLLIADEFNLRIRRISPAGTITTVAGNGSPGSTASGPALSVNLEDPMEVASDASGNIYVVLGTYLDKVDATGTVSRFYSGAFAVNAIAVDGQGNVLAATNGNVILKIAPNGSATTIAGTGQAGYSGDNGQATSAMVNGPQGVAVDSAGNIYIGDSYNNAVRKVSTGGTITTIGGQGSSEINGVPATQSAIYFPTALTVDGSGNLYIAETYGNRVRKISTNGVISAVAGNGSPGFSGDGGLATAASINQAGAVAVDQSGNIYISDRLNNRIREIPAAPPSISVSSTQVTISAPSFGAPTQTTITSSSSAQGLGYSVAFSTKTGGDWLGVSSLQGQAPGVFSIITDPSSLAPNTYQGTITITSPNAVPQVQSISVTFQVTAAVSATLAAGTGPLDFAVTVGSAPAIAQVTVSNLGGGALSFTASAATATGGSWLQISPVSGVATAAAPASITVTATPGSLAAGTYNGSITVNSATTGQTVTIPVTFAINPAPQQILLSQSGLTFTAVAQGGSVIPQSVGILNVGSGSMTWSATASTLSGSGWLNLSATSGTVTRPFLDVSFVDVSVNAQGLAAGQYYGTIQVTAPGASNSPQTVMVVVNVLPPGSNPGPQLGASGMVFTGVAGAENPGAQMVAIANVTSNPILYGSGVSYVNASNWITYLPANATVTPDVLAQITVQPNFNDLAAGIYRSALTFAFADGSVRTVSILAALAPAGTPEAIHNESKKSQLSPRGTGACTPAQLFPIFTQFGSGPSVSVGPPVAIIARVVDDCGSPLTSGSVVLSFSNGDQSLSMINLQDGQWTATWQPAHSSTAGVTISLTAMESAVSGSIETTVGFQGTQNLPMASGGVMNAVTLTQGPVAPGELVLIKGSGLADTPTVATSMPLMQQLGGASVLLGTGLANLLYADSSQVVGQVPFSLPVNTSQQLVLQRDSSVGVPGSVIVSAAQPAIFTENGSGTGQALIYKASTGGAAGSLADSSNPVQPGDTIVVYCAGLGVTDAKGNASNTATLTIGGLSAPISYAGVALAASYPSGGAPTLLSGTVSTGLAGLYQITATVPAGIGGQVPVTISSAGAVSQSGVTMMLAALSSGGLPNITSVDTAGGPLTIAQNGWIEIKGANLAPSSAGTGLTWSNAPDFQFGQLPTQLGGVSVTVNGKPAFVYFVSPAQLNVLTPLDSTTGPVQVVVNNNGQISAPFTITENAVAPSFLLFGATKYIVATHSNYSLAGPASLSSPGYPFTPAAPGETVTFYAVGFGLPSTPLVDGSATQSGSLATPPVITIGGTPATVSFAGVISPGLYQLNVVIPPNAANGDNTVTCSYGGLATPAGDLITVQH